MRRLFIIIIYILVTHPLSAQRISREYRDVPLSEALRQISQEQKRWSINFLYDELEDFRITTQVKNASVPNALRQIIGFYPLRMIVRERDIYVECPIKTGRRYVGELRDEEDQPVAFANLCLLSPQDSTVLARGVSSEGGTFVIPCDSQNVLLRATFIGLPVAERRLGHTANALEPDSAERLAGERRTPDSQGRKRTLDV